MKNTVLLFALLIILCGKVEAIAQTFSFENLSNSVKREIPLKGEETDNDEGILRSPSFQSATAFLYGKDVYIEFYFPVASVTVSIMSEVTGEYVYSGHYSYSEVIEVSLESEESGCYHIELDCPSSILWGQFTLD